MGLELTPLPRCHTFTFIHIQISILSHFQSTLRGVFHSNRREQEGRMWEQRDTQLQREEEATGRQHGERRRRQVRRGG